MPEGESASDGDRPQARGWSAPSRHRTAECPRAAAGGLGTPPLVSAKWTWFRFERSGRQCSVSHRAVSRRDGRDDVPVRERRQPIRYRDDVAFVVDRSHRPGERRVDSRSVSCADVDPVVEIWRPRIAELPLTIWCAWNGRTGHPYADAPSAAAAVSTAPQQTTDAILCGDPRAAVWISPAASRPPRRRHSPDARQRRRPPGKGAQEIDSTNADDLVQTPRPPLSPRFVCCAR